MFEHMEAGEPAFTHAPRHSTASPFDSSQPPSPAASRVTPCQLRVGEHALLPLTIDSKAVFDHYVRAMGGVVADLSFTNNFIWLSRMSGFYQIVHDCFCLFSLNGNRLTMLLPPIGPAERQDEALATCFEIMDASNPTPAWSTVEYVNHELAERLRQDGRWSLEPMFPDYIYRTSDLIELRGNAYKTKRSEINQFLRGYPQHRLEVLRPEHHAGVRELLHTWLRERIQHLHGRMLAEFVASVELERQGIERALEHYEALGLSGLVLIIDGRIEGFTFGERINDSMASILVEKTNFAIPAAAQYLFREFTKTFADCAYINVGDDLGLENLRRVKMSYRPVMFGEKFSLRRRLG